MKKHLFTLYLLFFSPVWLQAQQKVDHLIVVTTDGFRWQELFGGMDSSIAVQARYNQRDSAAIFKKYWAAEPAQRRSLLMPFFWNTIAKEGQVYGNRKHGNYVNTANKFRFSYPGYNEIFTGYPDTLVNSNGHPDNANINVLEYLNNQPAFKGKVAAFTAWNAFNQILNEKRSGMPVIAAFDTVLGKKLTPQQRLINKMLLNSYKPWHQDECLDVFTHYAAVEYLKAAKPKVLYIAYGETDEWAHSGQYRDYLDAAKQVDKWLEELWNHIQSSPTYKNRTAIIITTDHGRGVGAEWTDHWTNVEGSDEIWFAVMGPGLPAKGEATGSMQLYQQQLAQTISGLLGIDFKAKHTIAKSLLEVIK